MAKHRVNDQCIGCPACTRVAGDHFKMEDQRALLTKQPQTSVEMEKAEAVRGVCPTVRSNARTLLRSSDPPRYVRPLKAHPELKEVLLALSPKFAKLQRPAMW